MNSFNYNNFRFLDDFYKNILGNKFSTKYINYCLTRIKNSQKKTNKIKIYSDNTLLYSTSCKSNLEKQELLLVIPYVYQHYNNITVVNTISFITPIIQDICNNCNFIYNSPYNKDLLNYEYANKLNTIYNQFE